MAGEGGGSFFRGHGRVGGHGHGVVAAYRAAAKKKPSSKPTTKARKKIKKISESEMGPRRVWVSLGFRLGGEGAGVPRPRRAAGLLCVHEPPLE